MAINKLCFNVNLQHKFDPSIPFFYGWPFLLIFVATRLHFCYASLMTARIKNEDVILALRKAGISRTSQRVAVLSTLFTASQPLSAGAIRQCLKAKISIDKVTVYRILSIFRERGLIREIASAGGTGYFEIMTPENTLHPHFSCRSCGTVTCMPPQSFINMPEWIQAKDDYCIEHIEISVSGLCSGCRNETSSEQPKRHHRKER